MLRTIAILLSLFILCVLIRLSIDFFSKDRIATGLITTEGASPSLSGCDDLLNCTSSTASSRKNHIEPITYQTESTTVIEQIAKVISEQKDTTIITQTANYLHATFKTPLMGYIDDLELLLDDSGGLQIRSASRIGRSDFGANRKRIEALRALLLGKI